MSSDRSAHRASTRREVRAALALRRLPPRVALFQWRARRLATRIDDLFALASGTRPENLALLLGTARGCRRVVELGTGVGWTTASLALADSSRTVVSYDPIDRPERAGYLALAGAAAHRIRLVNAPGERGPVDEEPVDLLFIDSSHGEEETIREVHAWRPVLSDRSSIVFDDYGHPEYPGVTAAVRTLGLAGEQRGSLFIAAAASTP
jgi:predicted O-methyltransferase YrrM